MVREFANHLAGLGSIPGRVIPKTQKMVLDVSLLNTQHYKVWIKGKVVQSWERSSAPPTPWCSSYQKGSLRVTLDYSRQLYLTYKGCIEWKVCEALVYNMVFIFLFIRFQFVWSNILLVIKKPMAASLFGNLGCLKWIWNEGFSLKKRCLLFSDEGPQLLCWHNKTK